MNALVKVTYKDYNGTIVSKMTSVSDYGNGMIHHFRDFYKSTSPSGNTAGMTTYIGADMVSRNYPGAIDLINVAMRGGLTNSGLEAYLNTNSLPYFDGSPMYEWKYNRGEYSNSFKETFLLDFANLSETPQKIEVKIQPLCKKISRTFQPVKDAGLKVTFNVPAISNVCAIEYGGVRESCWRSARGMSPGRPGQSFTVPKLGMVGNEADIYVCTEDPEALETAISVEDVIVE